MVKIIKILRTFQFQLEVQKQKIPNEFSFYSFRERKNDFLNNKMSYLSENVSLIVIIALKQDAEKFNVFPN